MPSPTDGVCSRGFPTAWFWTFNFANAKTKGIFAIFTCLSYAYAWYNQLHNGVPFSPWALNACTGWTTLMKWTLIPFCFTLIISIVTSSLIYCLLIKTFHQISCSFLPDRAIIYLFFFFLDTCLSLTRILSRQTKNFPQLPEIAGHMVSHHSSCAVLLTGQLNIWKGLDIHTWRLVTNSGSHFLYIRHAAWCRASQNVI